MLRLALVMLPGLLAGCGQTRFSLPDDRQVQGHVTAADAERHSVQLRLADGRTRWLSLEQVDAVDLPGSGGIIGGAALTVLGGVLLGTTLGTESRSVAGGYGRGAVIGSASLLALAGLTWTGLSVHARLNADALVDEARGGR